MDTFVHVEVRGCVNKKVAANAINKSITRMKKLAAGLDCGSDEYREGADAVKVLEEAARVKRLTGGLFDINFESGGKMDLGGIAKGFVVDEGIRVLKKHGIKKAIINAGGDMYCMGKFRVGVRDPRHRHKVLAVLSARDKGIATSAAYERGGHIIDPKKRKPVIKQGKSVTVVAETCMMADALATALYIAEPLRGLSIMEEIDGAECFIIDETGKTYISDGLKAGQILKS